MHTVLLRVRHNGCAADPRSIAKGNHVGFVALGLQEALSCDNRDILCRKLGSDSG